MDEGKTRLRGPVTSSLSRSSKADPHIVIAWDRDGMASQEWAGADFQGVK